MQLKQYYNKFNKDLKNGPHTKKTLFKKKEERKRVYLGLVEELQFGTSKLEQEPQAILEWKAFPSPGDLPNPGIEPKSPTLQADSLAAEPQGKPNK